MAEIFDVTEDEVVDVTEEYTDYSDEAEDEGGTSILGFLIAAGIGAGAGYGLSKFIPWAKNKKLEADKRKVEKLQARIEKAEEEEVDPEELQELTPEETEEIKKLEAESKNKKSKK